MEHILLRDATDEQFTERANQIFSNILGIDFLAERYGNADLVTSKKLWTEDFFKPKRMFQLINLARNVKDFVLRYPSTASCTLDQYLVAFVYTFLTLSHYDFASSGKVTERYFRLFQPTVAIGIFENPDHPTHHPNKNEGRTREFYNFEEMVKLMSLLMTHPEISKKNKLCIWWEKI